MTQAIATKFNFKARIIRDDAGKEVGKTKKQNPLNVELPIPTDQEIVDALCLADVEVPAKKEGEQPTLEVPKIKQLIRDAVAEIVRAQAKAQLDDVIDSFAADETKTVTASDIDFDKLSLEFIANLPPAQRGAKAIPDEDWEAFYQDYMQVMVVATGKPETKIKTHLDLFKKPTRAKQNKEALAVLVDQLDVYTTASANIEETADCAQRLRGKFDKWIKEDDKLDVSAL